MARKSRNRTRIPLLPGDIDTTRKGHKPLGNPVT